LKKILRKNQESAFGKAHGFSDIHSEEGFRKQVPIREFEEIRPYINSILAGKKAVLTAGEPIRFNVTSGTTGEPKFVPVTRTYQNQELNLIGQWYYRALRDHPGFLDHYRVAIVSPLNDGKTDSGISYGNASGMVFSRIPTFIRRFYALPDSVFQIKDYDDRYFLMARYAVAQKVSFVLTPNPSTLIRLAEIIQSHADEMIQAIRDGNPGRDLSSQPDLLNDLAQRLTPDPSRAKFLERRLKTKGTLRPSDVWPELKLIACWLGGSVGMQASRLSEFYGNVPVRDFGYVASEAHVTVPIQDDTASGILAIQTNYYEFVPEEAHGTQNPPVLSGHQVEQGKRYALLLTTSAGLYRYDINDIVEVTGFYHQTPLLAFVRKGRDMTNITGEKMHANHFISAVGEIRRELNLPIAHYRVSPDYENSRYCIYIETSGDVSEEILRDKTIPLIDRALRKVNVEYDQKRASKRLKLPAIALMKRGWAEDECRRFLEAGKKDVQFKWRVLSPEAVREDLAAIRKKVERRED
ncbi:MAG: GH3 auxin-responsive promoter family protein, partial [Candidatus Omnitrophica bacterium]|nr:GH3 auxin-responsive promoter family protein [Candidatus Omnitrophota bacterium]